jgi:hypothetical protein
MALAAWFAAHPELESNEDAIAGFRCARDISALATRPGDSRPRAYVTSSATLLYPHFLYPPGEVAPSLNAGIRADRLGDERARVADTLHELFPEASVLIVTRGFRDVLLSGYSQHVRMGGRTSIADLFAEVGEHLNYDSVLELYEKKFGGERLVVLPYELLRDEPERFTSEVEGHLGVSGGGTLPRLNQALSPAALYWYPKLSLVVTRALSGAGERARRRLWQAYAVWIARDALAGPARMLGRLAPGRRVTAADIPDRILEALRGRAERLRGRALYEPYQADYLNER